MLTPQRPLDHWYPSCGCSVSDQSPYLSQIFPIVVPSIFLMVHSLSSNFLGCASMTPFCCAVTHPLLTDALLSSVLLYPFRIFDILLSWWLTSLPINLVMQLTHSFTQQLIHASYAYSFLLILCLLIAYKPLTKLLPIPYQSLTNSAYSLLFLYFNAVPPHVFKPLGSAQWGETQLHEIIPLSDSLSQYPLSSLGLVGFSEGLKALIFKFYPIYSSPSLSLGSSGV